MRTDVQCRERFKNILDPNLKSIYNPQDDLENQEIMRLHQLHGDKWSKIAKHLGNTRTDNYCKRIVRQTLSGKKKNRGRNRSEPIDVE